MQAPKPTFSEPPPKAEPAKAEAPKPEPAKVEAKPEPAKVEAPKPEPAKVEAKPEPEKVEAKPEPEKVEAKPEPAKVEAKPEPEKVEAKPAPRERVDDRSKPQAKVEPKKATPAKVEERSGKRPEQGRTEKPRRSAQTEEELDASSISAEFFRKDQDSVPPVEEHEDIEPPSVLVLSAATLARRARFRRLVAGVVAFAGVVSVAVVGKALVMTKRQPPMPAQAMEAKHEISTPEPAKPAEAKPVEAKADAPKQDDAKVENPKGDAAKPDTAAVDSAKPAATPGPDDAKKDDAKKDDAKKDEAKPDEKKDEAKPAPTGDPKVLKRETESLLNRGKNKEAIEKAKELIAADPTEASGYLFLGAALQETGKMKDAIEAYCDCVRNSTKGPINECRAVGGHK